MLELFDLLKAKGIHYKYSPKGDLLTFNTSEGKYLLSKGHCYSHKTLEEVNLKEVIEAHNPAF